MRVLLLVVIGLTVVITALAVWLMGDRPGGLLGRRAFQEPSDPLLIISTRTPTPPPIHTPTRTRIVVVAPTRRATLTPTFTPAPRFTSTPASSGESVVDTESLTRAAASTSAPDLLPAVSPTPPTLISPPPVFRRSPVPVPVLKEPDVGAEMPFDRVVRFKFVWSRELGTDERVMLHIRSIDHAGEFTWSARKEDILHGGGRIYGVQEGVLYEVNSGFGKVPPGKAVWRVAIVLDTWTEKRQISSWSEERPIVRRAP